MEDFFRVGVITSTHGLKGEVKVFPTTDEPERFRKLKEIIMDTGKERTTLHPVSVRFFKNMVILKFREFDSVDQVEGLRQAELYVARKDALPLSENENYIADLIGLSVAEDTEGRIIGTLTDVLQTAANDVYVVDMDGKEVLLPSIPECILNVDLEAGIITVHLMDGLLD